MGNTFGQKVIMTILAGCAAAGLLYVYNHVIARSLFETGEGWRESTFIEKPAKK